MSKPTRAQLRAQLAEGNDHYSSTALDDKLRAAELARRTRTATTTTR